jgi:hypothetical protein
MMVIYLKVFRAARARIHKKQFRSCCQDDTSRFNAASTLEVCATDFDDNSAVATPREGFRNNVARASIRERVNHGAATDDEDDAGSSTGSRTSPTFCASTTAPGTIVSNGQSPTAIVTLTVFSCDDDEMEMDNNSSPLTPPPEHGSVGDSTATCSSIGMPIATCRRPDRLSLGPRFDDCNGVSISGSVTPSNCRLPSSYSATVISGSGLSSAALSPPGSPSVCRTGNHLLATPHRTSRACSLRGSWLDLTKAFILDRRRDSPPKSKVSNFVKQHQFELLCYNIRRKSQFRNNSLC